MVPYSETTSEDLSLCRGGCGPLSQYSVKLRWKWVCEGPSVLPFCCLPSLCQAVCSFRTGHISPVLEVGVEAAKEVTRDNCLVRLHHPAGSWDTCETGEVLVFYFL